MRRDQVNAGGQDRLLVPAGRSRIRSVMSGIAGISQELQGLMSGIAKGVLWAKTSN